MTKPTTTQQLDALRARASELRQAERQVQQDERDAHAALGEAREALVDAYTREQDPGAATKALKAAEAAVDQPWAQLSEAARRRAQRANQDVGEYITTHIGALLGELTPAARDAQAAIVTALQAVLDSVTAWHRLTAVADGLTSVAYGPNAARAHLNLDTVTNQVRRTLDAGISYPIQTLNSNDPTIRSAAA